MAANQRVGRGRSIILVIYMAYLHNHAAPLGCFTVDGCGEFTPTGADGTPESFQCVACNCHRNFHQKVEMDIPPPRCRRPPRVRQDTNLAAAAAPPPPSTPPQPVVTLNYPPASPPLTDISSEDRV
ncbi:unnamed protein product [Fraxinus pennsylvanica]|uniref:ZF-HD dimerization-type domain-containing protein n=1 Tax=Fraxinus pennsylvanica TaxID=56036 RepID=A0AAD1ZAU6_9LAMI|nr:unnamed protein product [Fraxinus pennsylvanica]